MSSKSVNTRSGWLCINLVTKFPTPQNIIHTRPSTSVEQLLDASFQK